MPRIATKLRNISPSKRALIGTSLGSLPGFLLPFALSWRLHAGRLTDAYFFSFAIATFVATILSNVFEVNMIPAAAASKQSGGNSLAELVRTTIRNSLGIATAAYILTGIVGVVIVNTRHTWTTDQKHLCIVLIFVFSIYIAAIAVTSILAGTLYALGQFFIPTLSQCLRALLPLAFIALTEPNDFGVILTASLLVAGELVRGLILMRVLWAQIPSIVGDGTPTKPSRLLEASVPLALSLLVVTASPVVDKIVASPLGTGSVTVLELAEKVFFVPVIAITSSVILVAGSRWAGLVHHNPSAVTRDYSRTLRRLVMLSVVAAVVVGGVTTLVTIVAGDRFLSLNALQFRVLVLIFLGGLPGALIITLGARVMTSVQRTRLLPLFAISAFTVNLVGDIVGAHFLGVDGIALASTVFRYVNAGLYIWTCALVLRAVSTSPKDGEARVPFLLR